VHRSHSGRYGLVNSEEVYQNLKRFLFGTLRVEIELAGLDRTLLDDRVWQADTRLAIREVPVLMHEQTAEHHCPVDLNQESKNEGTARDEAMAPVPLVTIFLAPDPRKDTCRYALTLGVTSLKEQGGWFGFGGHLEKTADWEDALVVDITITKEGAGAGNVTGAHCQWNSELEGRIADATTDDLVLNLVNAREDGVWRGSVPLPASARKMLGEESTLNFVASLWD
jgi:hypothetical protein